jgi:hypothetical protein
LLPVQVEGQPLLLRVVGVATKFPTTHGDFVVADRSSVATAMNAAAPGSGVTNEFWIDAAPGRSPQALAAALRRPPFADLQVRSRLALLAHLRSDPLARGALLALGAAAIVSLVLALLGLLLWLVFDLRDERGDLFDLEAQGAEPRTLLSHLRLRSLLVATFGLAGGVAAGAVLSALTVDLVRLTAGATEPEPPLRLAIDWPVLGIGVAAFSAAAALLVLVTTRWGQARAAPAGRYSEVAA